MDDELKHVCNEVGIPRHSRSIMIEHGLRTIDDLSSVQGLIQREELDDLRDETRESLLVVTEWLDKNPNANVLEDFNECVYDKIYKDHRWAEKYINLALGQPYCEENLKMFQYANDNSDQLDALSKVCTNEVMESQSLRKSCGNFDYNSFLDKAIRHFHDLVGEESGILEKIFIIAGRTQSGKSSCKGAIQSLCGVLRIPLVVLTKGVDESIDLHAKMVQLSDGTLVQEKHIVVASGKKDGIRSYRIKNMLANQALGGKTHGGTLVIADTYAQVVNKACRAIRHYRENIPGGKFVLVVDEADAMYRTTTRHQLFEQALEQLMDMHPSMVTMISATPIPFMLELLQRGDKSADDIEFFNLRHHENYNGIENIQPLTINRKSVYLAQNELKHSSEYTSDGVTICCANEENMALFDDAMAGKGKNVLVLDASCPRVYATNNIRDKAAGVQKLYKKRGKSCVVIAFSGKGMSVKFPGMKWEYNKWKKSLIGKLLEHIDEVYGSGVPVFIFGYTKLCRGISFRSSDRVPTHMVMAMGRGHNISTIVQTLGRATFNGKDVLKENGFDYVTVLTTSNDYTLCTKVQEYINVVAQRIDAGDTFAEAVTGANVKIPDSANFLRHTFREIGKIKGGRSEFEKIVNMENIPGGLSPDEEETKEKFWDDEGAQKLLRSLARLRKGNALVEKDDILEDMHEAEHYPMKNKNLQPLLRKFVDKSLIVKEKPREREPQYRVRPILYLMRFMNPEKGELPPDDDEDDDDLENHPEAKEEGTINPSPGMQHMVSDLTEQSAADSFFTPPLVIDLSNEDDEYTLSSITVDASGNDRTPPSNSNVVSPAESAGTKHDLVSEGDGLIGKRVAKCFDKLHFGNVVNFDNFTKQWSIKYDDGDDEEFNKDELRQAFHLYNERKGSDHSKPSSANEISPALTSIDGIPLERCDDKTVSGKCIVQPEKKRRIYYTEKGDTPIKVAKRFRVDVLQIIRINRRRENYAKMTKKSPFDINSPVVLPLGDDEV